ncbi:lytic transglycosylase F [Aeromonas fluvialis]|uniref:transglycosylase SLT domain-containing protein n=1 Tax=Aeromonas fluvialis TaxID=591962 RepID=UPI0005AB51E4|nr:lytic transglycosylase F [Aeromonas fluvialis]
MSVLNRLAGLFSLLLLALPLSSPHAATPAEETAREQLTLTTDDLLQPWSGDLPGMLDRRVIRVLTVYSKTFYFVDKGTQRGATYDSLMEFERYLNIQLAKEKKLTQRHLKMRVIFIPVARGELFQALREGKGDIAAANLTITPARLELVDFTQPIYKGVSELLVSGPDSPQVDTLEDLAGKTVFVRYSSSYYESLQALNARFVQEGRPPVRLKEAPDALEDEDLLEMLSAGLIPLLVVDSHKANFWKQIFPTLRVHDRVTLRRDGEIAWAVRKESPELRAMLNNYIKLHGQGSITGNTLLNRYFKSSKYVKNANSEQERVKFLNIINLFKQYGDKYDVDWLLMAAQGYQESRLNQKARSHVGAIGVMQIMPATGKDLKVGDIRQLEPNIHGGIKYMRWMIDNYYGDEPMSRLDKALFSFASYNAGPARIAKLRKLTEQRGFNPNVWFGNVEHIAAEKIGAETVTYVGNIYKYYVAYKLLMDAQAEKRQVTEEIKKSTSQ